MLANSKRIEVLAEAIQTVHREGISVPNVKNAYARKQVTLEDFAIFIDTLAVDEKVKKRLKALRPENYIGLTEIARNG